MGLTLRVWKDFSNNAGSTFAEIQSQSAVGHPIHFDDFAVRPRKLILPQSFAHQWHYSSCGHAGQDSQGARRILPASSRVVCAGILRPLGYSCGVGMDPVSNLRPTKHTYTFLISSPTHFVGEYHSKHFLLSHAWPSSGTQGLYANDSNDPTYRKFLVISFSDEKRKQEPEKSIVLPTYTYVPDVFCVFLSILFGKRFDSEGCLQTHGHYSVPTITPAVANPFPRWSAFSQAPRKDVGIELNLAKAQLIDPILNAVFEEMIDEATISDKIELVFAAGKFYLQALQQVQSDAEIAFLNLISAGEVLSGGFRFDDAELFDDETREILDTIRRQAGEAVHDRVKGRMYQVRRKFRLTLCRLLNDQFFSTSESSEAWGALKKDEIETRLNAAYDLRSRYLHTGARFDGWIRPTGQLWEVLIGQPRVEPPEWKKILSSTPTFIGLERVVRYALLRFIHLHITPIDDRLD
jgi:hypothetical protein